MLTALFFTAISLLVGHMSSFIQTTRPLWKESLWKAILASLLFLLLNTFSQYNVIRENVEDFAFDITNEWSISKKEQATASERVTVFAFDNQYMADNGLFDIDEDSDQKEKNIANYGYVFPRENLAQFIEQLDARVEKLSIIPSFTCPKALFIDFDLSFPTGTSKKQTPLAENLTKGDKHLLTTLEKPKRCYKILLAKNNTHHYVKDYANSQLKQLIEDKRIRFVSPYFHASADGSSTIRRHEPIKKIAGTTYPSAAIALWQISKTGMIDVTAVEQQFTDAVKDNSKNSKVVQKNRGNVNDNMILIKHYKRPENYNCPEKSYWSQLRKYAVGCTKEIPHTDLNNTVLMLGGTYQENSRYALGANDYHNVLNFMDGEPMAGVDIHANTLMTLFYLDQTNGTVLKAPVMKPLWMPTSLLVIFISFFLIDFFIAYLLQRKEINNKELHFILLLIINTLVLYSISLYFLNSEKHQWFNWAISSILNDISGGMFLVRSRLANLFLVKISAVFKQQLITLMSYFRRTP